MADPQHTSPDHRRVIDFVRSFHVRFDGSFPEAPTTLGPSSYALLANEAEAINELGNTPVVLDLGCGSGRLLEILLERGFPPENLIGVDFVEQQINRTKERLADAPVRLMVARADALPLETGSVGCILVHMSLAVMLPLGATLRELVRVLRNGGVLAVVVDGPPKEGSIDHGYSQILRKVVLDKQPDLLNHATGSPDVSDATMLAYLFKSETGAVLNHVVRPFDLMMSMSSSEYLEFLEGEYLLSGLYESARQQVRNEVAQLFEPYEKARVDIPLAMQLVVFTKPAAGINDA